MPSLLDDKTARVERIEAAPEASQRAPEAGLVHLNAPSLQPDIAPAERLARPSTVGRWVAAGAFLLLALVGLERTRIIAVPPETDAYGGAIVLAFGGSDYQRLDVITGPCTRASLPARFCTGLGTIAVGDRTRAHLVLPWHEGLGRWMIGQIR